MKGTENLGGDSQKRRLSSAQPPLELKGRRRVGGQSIEQILRSLKSGLAGMLPILTLPVLPDDKPRTGNRGAPTHGFAWNNHCYID